MKGYGSPILCKYISCYSLSACVVLMSLLQIENFHYRLATSICAMRLPFLVAIFSAVVVADSSWSWFQEDNAIDDLENTYSQSAPGSLSTQSDSSLSPDQVASTDLARKNTQSVFQPDCTGFEFTLCCTGVQTEDWNTMDGKFFSITKCKKCMFLYSSRQRKRLFFFLP